jgi:hypothetical protein
MKKEPLCLRCGMSKQEARSTGAKCATWGEWYAAHMWKVRKQKSV